LQILIIDYLQYLCLYYTSHAKAKPFAKPVGYLSERCMRQ